MPLSGASVGILGILFAPEGYGWPVGADPGSSLASSCDSYRAAGTPDHDWNMAGKAGATPETDDAGIDLNDVRSTETPSKL